MATCINMARMRAREDEGFHEFVAARCPASSGLTAYVLTGDQELAGDLAQTAPATGQQAPLEPARPRCRFALILVANEVNGQSMRKGSDQIRLLGGVLAGRG